MHDGISFQYLFSVLIAASVPVVDLSGRVTQAAVETATGRKKMVDSVARTS